MSLTMKIEEIGTVGTITLNAFKSKKADFVNFSSDYGGTFESDYSGKLTDVINVITTKFHIGQIKHQTELIEEEIKLFYPMLDYVQKYAKKTRLTLTVPLSNFGVKEVRHGIHTKDIEELNGALNTLQQNIDSNKTDLMAKGYKDEDYAAFTELKKKVFDDNVLQEGWKYDKQQAIENNMDLFLEVEEIIKDIQETGKILFKRTEPAVALEFTMSDVLRKIRQENGENVGPKVSGPTTTLTVDCFKKGTTQPIKDLTVDVFEYGLQMKTDNAGRAKFDYVPLEPHNKVTVKISGTGWVSVTVAEKELIEGEITDLDVFLDAM